jgi:hypothetical protein
LLIHAKVCLVANNNASALLIKGTRMNYYKNLVLQATMLSALRKMTTFMRTPRGVSATSGIGLYQSYAWRRVFSSLPRIASA